MTSPLPRVLVIEDDPDVATMIAVTLRRAGFDVTVAHDGAGGIAAAQEEPPAAVVLDLRMVPMDGYAVLEELRADDRTSSIPVVVASILGMEERARRLGVSAYLRKPFVPGEVAQTVRGVIANA